MADEEPECDSKPPLTISFSSVDLARRPLSVSSPNNTDQEGTDSVVDLTGDSTDEDEVVDLTSPMESRNFVSVERDGFYIQPPAHPDNDQVIVEHVTPPLPPSPSDVSIILPPCLPTSHQGRNNVAPPTSDSNDSDDDVIIVSSYSPNSSHTHAAPPILNTSPSTVPLSPHISKIVTCPICMETQKNFTRTGSNLVATKCGHLFCDSCLKKAISLTRKCPTCSSRLSARQFHRIYL